MQWCGLVPRTTMLFPVLYSTYGALRLGATCKLFSCQPDSLAKGERFHSGDFPREPIDSLCLQENCRLPARPKRCITRRYFCFHRRCFGTFSLHDPGSCIFRSTCRTTSAGEKGAAWPPGRGGYTSCPAPRRATCFRWSSSGDRGNETKQRRHEVA